ncbi:hypothetical protein [Propionibacterium acidifaciens]|uniref:hypothetical protein n=1 Tax=Propionibacterium acidifaciens TaxID=556499 RepID=UPI0012DEC69E|nr:hypothetical protein [Propionibacterium acidifaciens]
MDFLCCFGCDWDTQVEVTPEETFGAFASYVTSRTFDHDFEHLPLRETRNDLVS